MKSRQRQRCRDLRIRLLAGTYANSVRIDLPIPLDAPFPNVITCATHFIPFPFFFLALIITYTMKEGGRVFLYNLKSSAQVGGTKKHSSWV